MTEDMKKKILIEISTLKMDEEKMIKGLQKVRDDLNKLSQTIFNNTIKSIEEHSPDRVESLFKQQKLVDNSIEELTHIIIQLLETVNENTQQGIKNG